MKTQMMIIIAAIAIAFGCSPEKPSIPEITYKIVQDKLEKAPRRYEIRVETNKHCNEWPLKEISEYLKKTHDESDTFIIFYQEEGKSNAYARIDYPHYKYEKLPELIN